MFTKTNFYTGSGGVESIKEKKRQLIFKALRFRYCTACIFCKQPLKQPLKTIGTKTIAIKP